MKKVFNLVTILVIVSFVFEVQAEGKWGSWGRWRKCSKLCKSGTRMRYRNCKGGACLSGSNREIQECNKKPCPNVISCSGSSIPYMPEYTCIKPSQFRRSFDGARAFCKKYGADLVTVVNSDQDRFLTKIAKKKAEYLIGLKLNLLGGNQTWVRDGRQLSFWPPWAPGEPKVENNCVVKEPLRNQWVSKNCSSSNVFYFFCEGNPYTPVDGKWSAWGKWSSCSKSCGGGTKIRTRACVGRRHKGKACIGMFLEKHPCNSRPCPARCKEGWILSKSSKMCIKAFEETKRTWYDARRFCVQQGGDLLAIRNQQVMDFIKGVMGKHRYWIGLHQPERDGIFKWLSDQRETDYKNFRYKPLIHLGDEWCAELIGRHGGQWNDKPCYNKRHHICQIPINS